MNTSAEFEGLSLGGDTQAKPENKQIDQESGFEIGSPEHRNYYREKKDNERRAKEMEQMQGSIVNQVVQQLAPMFQSQTAPQNQPVQKTFDDYIPPDIRDDVSALDPALRGTADYAVHQSTAYANEVVGRVGSQLSELEQYQKQMGNKFAWMDAMFKVDDQATVRKPEFQQFLEAETIMGYSVKDMLDNHATHGNQAAVVHGLNEAVARFKAQNNNATPTVNQMANPAQETFSSHIPNPNQPMLDETWEAKLENAKSNYRNDSKLSFEQKSQWDLKYEAIQSRLRKLPSLRGNPQAYQSAQQEVTSLAINLGVIRP
ncbi:MAG: hypothetical protein E6R13_02505 [Spirochaetes bacterium]|nr:MAG: hypothetical protein E6R13_02505 [Spirochaetota bacterium]